MPIGTRLFTFFRGRSVGTDAQGNRYFEERRAVAGRKKRRWVMYKGAEEPSRVPPQWHGWLHYTFDTPPDMEKITPHAWEKPHVPNMTGTSHAYYPPGHALRGGRREKATGDYQAWQPTE